MRATVMVLAWSGLIVGVFGARRANVVPRMSPPMRPPAAPAFADTTAASRPAASRSIATPASKAEMADRGTSGGGVHLHAAEVRPNLARSSLGRSDFGSPTRGRVGTQTTLAGNLVALGSGHHSVVAAKAESEGHASEEAMLATDTDAASASTEDKTLGTVSLAGGGAAAAVATAAVAKKTTVRPTQLFAGLALAFGLTSTVIAFLWMEFYLKGGAAAGLIWGDTAGKLWNFHPFLMTVAFVFFGPAAMLVYRFGPFDKKTATNLHFALQTAAVVAGSAAFYAVYAQHEAAKASDFAITHGWIGLLCFGFYVVNYLVGVVSLSDLVPAADKEAKKAQALAKKEVTPYHVVLGVALLALMFAAVTSGTAEKLAFMKTCAVAPRGWGWGDLSFECKLGNAFSVTTTLTILLTFAALMIPAHPSTRK